LIGGDRAGGFASVISALRSTVLLTAPTAVATAVDVTDISVGSLLAHD